MTCKDCIHCNLCVSDERIFMGECEHFKNKADFVEVVRCKDCKEWSSIGPAENAGWCKKNNIGTLYNYYCNFGERSDK